MLKITSKILSYTFFLTIIAATFLYIAYDKLPDQKLHLYFLDVGQGDAALVVTPNQKKILIDGGPHSNVLSPLGEIMPFYDRTIDLIILTHPHSDHIDGLVEVLKRYQVKAVLATGVYYKSQTYLEFLKTIKTQNIPFIITESKKDLLIDQVQFDFLFPFEDVSLEEFKNLNNSSLVFKLTYGESEVLYTGDAEVEVEELLVKYQIDLESDVLKVGHHGSKTASSLSFLKQAKPSLTVISLGKDNKFNHPHVETIRNLKKLRISNLRTDLTGTIEVLCDIKKCTSTKD